MATVITLSCGSGTVWDSASGTLICAPGVNELVALGSEVPSVTPSDIGVLLTLALAIFAATWGFRVLGSLLYKTS